MGLELKKRHLLLFGTITCICILAIAVVFYWGIFLQEKKEPIQVDEVRVEELKSNFHSLFDNQLHAVDYPFSNITKQSNDRNVIYTDWAKSERNSGKYDMAVDIPMINIQSEEIQKCNEKINKTFLEKANQIMKQENAENIAYTVKYVAYVNKDILSLVILSNLKEGQSPQREIILTYNYDLIENRILNLPEVLSKLQIEQQLVQYRIQNEVAKEQQQTQELKKLGYENLYTRDLNSDMYEVGNTDNFFLGSDGMLYIIYAYGNRNHTNTTDLILLPYE